MSSYAESLQQCRRTNKGRNKELIEFYNENSTFVTPCGSQVSFLSLSVNNQEKISQQEKHFSRKCLKTIFN